MRELMAEGTYTVNNVRIAGRIIIFRHLTTARISIYHDSVECQRTTIVAAIQIPHVRPYGILTTT